MKQTFKVVGEIKLKNILLLFLSLNKLLPVIVIVFIVLFSSYCVDTKNKSAVCGNETK